MGFANQSVSKCDDTLNGWYRFTEKSGTQMPEQCVPIKRCGTLATGWLNGEHPSVDELVVTREVCYHWEGDCCKWKNNIQVRNCGDFYVYELGPTPNCKYRYCGNKDIGIRFYAIKSTFYLNSFACLIIYLKKKHCHCRAG